MEQAIIASATVLICIRCDTCHQLDANLLGKPRLP